MSLSAVMSVAFEHLDLVAVGILDEEIAGDQRLVVITKLLDLAWREAKLLHPVAGGGK